jgi:hypothetical protein
VRAVSDRLFQRLFVLLLLGRLFLPALASAQEKQAGGTPLSVAQAGTVSAATPVTADASAVIRFDELARQEPQGPEVRRPDRTWTPGKSRGVPLETPAEPYFPPAPAEADQSRVIPDMPLAPSPSPSSSFMGLNDIPMVDSLYIVIPPDIGGAVGPDKIMEAFNNNYRIRDKTTGVTQGTVGTATFWAPVLALSERLALTDPRTLYDPYNNRWIAVMQTVTTGAGKLLVGVSQTSDPAGAWNLYSFNSGATVDFPTVGFNKNWISVAINRYGNGGLFQRGINLLVDYPSARAGSGVGTIVVHSVNTHFCSAPSVTYSSTEETLYIVTHLSSSGATYHLDTVTGTPAAPVYTSGGALTRTGGGWAQPGGNLLPQSAPNSGASACGATPCPIETSDAQVRSAAVYRDGFVYYTQTIGLPAAGLTHTGVQWTKIAAPGGVFSDGGRIEDPTATSTNGGKWYSFPHIAVNALGDFVLGYTQFSSAQHPSAGYSIHVASDGAGTIRDPLIYHAGEDYYHKTFSTANGRNRWGDFSTSQVDPSDDLTLWTIQQYARARSGTDDGNTGANSSRWSSWWAGISTVTSYTITASAGPNGSISPSGAVVVVAGADQSFTITPDSCHHVVDVLVDGVSIGAVTSHTFTNVQADHTISATFAIDTFTVVASAGPGGTISPDDSVSVSCGNDQAFTITPDSCSTIADVVVDGISIGAVTSHTFTDVQADHTIDVTFAPVGPFTITATAGAGGSITPAGLVNVPCGSDQQFDFTPDPGYSILAVTVDSLSVGSPASYTFTDVQAGHTIDVTFTDTGLPACLVNFPNGGDSLAVGSIVNLSWSASDNDSVACVDLFLSRTGVGGPYDTLALCLPDTGSLAWSVTGPPTTQARLRISARDASGNSCVDDSDNDFVIYDQISGAGDLPVTEFTLATVAPMTSRGPARFVLAVPTPGRVRIAVYDVSGRELAVLADREYAAGRHDVTWNGRGPSGRVSSGIYFIRATGPGKDQVQRLSVTH